MNNKNEPKNKFKLEDILEGKHPYYGTNKLKLRLIKEGIIDNKCDCCGLGTTWNGQLIVHHLDHINGISTDHRLSNLRLLCPNCHSQTHTYSGKNKFKPRTVSVKGKINQRKTENLKKDYLKLPMIPKEKLKSY